MILEKGFGYATIKIVGTLKTVSWNVKGANLASKRRKPLMYF